MDLAHVAMERLAEAVAAKGLLFHLQDFPII